MNKLFVYGTLRKGGRLHDDYLEGVEPLGKDWVTDFAMFSLRSYPFVARTNEMGSILGEVYEVTDEQMQSMADMETDAGYSIDVVDTVYGQAFIFYMPEGIINQYGYKEKPKVESGDWIKHLQTV